MRTMRVKMASKPIKSSANSYEKHSVFLYAAPLINFIN